MTNEHWLKLAAWHDDMARRYRDSDPDFIPGRDLAETHLDAARRIYRTLAGEDTTK